jgi:hypothetical protein
MTSQTTDRKRLADYCVGSAPEEGGRNKSNSPLHKNTTTE